MSTYEPGLKGKHLIPRDVHALLYKHGWTEPLNMCRLVATLQAESQFWTEAVGIPNDNGTQDFRDCVLDKPSRAVVDFGCGKYQ